MITQEDCYKQRGIYVYGGKLWRVLGYYEGPSVIMVDMEDADHKMDFGLGGIIAQRFKKVDGLEWQHNGEGFRVKD